MFPLTHIECAGRLVKADSQREKAALYLGAIFPDILKPFLGWEGAHALWRIAAVKEAALMSQGLERLFFEGLITHGVDPYGLDQYADRCMPGAEEGWSYITSAPIQHDFTRVTELEPPFDRWKCHNMAEMVIESYVAQMEEDRGPSVKALLLSERDFVDAMSRKIGRLAGIPEDTVAEAVFRFFDHVFHAKVEIRDYADRFSDLLRHELKSPVTGDDLCPLMLSIQKNMNGREGQVLNDLCEFASVDLNRIREEMQ